MAERKRRHRRDGALAKAAGDAIVRLMPIGEDHETDDRLECDCLVCTTIRELRAALDGPSQKEKNQ
jgi:hypothetical protein